MKERVLIFSCHPEHSNLLSDSLLSKGYEVRVLKDQDPDAIQRQISLYHPDYIVLEDDELIALTSH